MAEPCSWQARAAYHAASRGRARSQVPARCCSHGGAWRRPAGGRARLRERRRRPLRLHLDQVAGAPRQQRRGGSLALNAAGCKAAVSAPALPTHSLLRRARRRGRRHPAGLTRIRQPPRLALCLPLTARPCRLCALRQVHPEPIPLATSRPHGHSAAAARGSLYAQDHQTRCMQGLSPARARRAGRMPAPLCQARPPRRWRCPHVRRASTRASPRGVQRSAPALRALSRPPAAHPAALHRVSAGLPSRARPSRPQCARTRRRAPKLPIQCAAARPAPWSQHPCPGAGTCRSYLPKQQHAVSMPWHHACPELWQGSPVNQYVYGEPFPCQQPAAFAAHRRTACCGGAHALAKQGTVASCAAHCKARPLCQGPTRGCPVAAWWHVCHTVCRKGYTERRARGSAHPPRPRPAPGPRA